MSKTYTIEITETLRTTVAIEADSPEEALQIGQKLYEVEAVVLSSDDWVDTKIDVAGHPLP